jgi:hypothetical protein
MTTLGFMHKRQQGQLSVESFPRGLTEQFGLPLPSKNNVPVEPRIYIGSPGFNVKTGIAKVVPFLR